MGSDIHLLFEERDRQGRWTTLFEPRPDAKYWFDQIIEEKMSNGSAALMFSENGRMDTEEERRKVYDRTEDYFKSMTLDEAERQYGSHPQFCWDWYGRMPKPSG